MALQNTQYDEIMREYSRRQSENRRILEQRRRELYARFPRIPEIDSEIASASAAKARRLLSGSETGTQDLQLLISRLQEEQRQILRTGGYPEDSLEMPYTCPICQDTGYVNGEKCVCFRKAETDFLYQQSNLDEILQKENFEHFSFEYYSDTMLDDALKVTPRELASRAYQTALSFVEQFDRSYQNLFLYGETGVGKTFLSHCIARELLNRGHSVLYFSAYDLFDLLAQKTFSQREGSLPSDRVYDCDLLIIDDLGTELTNSFVASSLFFCINERISNRKATIISTNLTIENFSKTYSERTFSRIISQYQMLKLAGRDIRIQKKFTGGNH